MHICSQFNSVPGSQADRLLIINHDSGGIIINDDGIIHLGRRHNHLGLLCWDNDNFVLVLLPNTLNTRDGMDVMGGTIRLGHGLGLVKPVRDFRLFAETDSDDRFFGRFKSMSTC